jgi:putative protein kinase ArgK-like GTPase of G3E family
MAKAQSKAEGCESAEHEKRRRLVEEKGVAGAQAVMREKLESWKDVEIKIGVTGNAGVGKSSFINTFRGYCLSNAVFFHSALLYCTMLSH